MIMRMVEVLEALENVVMHRKFVEYVATLFNCQNGVQAHTLATQVRSMFWMRTSGDDVEIIRTWWRT